MIIDIRGTNGSGKSYPIHKLLEQFLTTEVKRQIWDTTCGEQVETTLIEPIDLALVGSYRTNCGGADEVTKQDAIVEVLRALNQRHKVVVVEGSIVASVYARWEALAREMDDKYIFMFLDTPVEECIASVRKRRLDKGNFKPFNPEQTLIPRHEAIQRLKDRLIEAGRNVETHSRDSIKTRIDEIIHQVNEGC